jgi:hypothetical protein
MMMITNHNSDKVLVVLAKHYGFVIDRISNSHFQLNHNLKGNDLTEYIAEQVYASSDKPNIRDCVRLATLCQTEQNVLRMMRILTSCGSHTEKARLVRT